MKLQIIFAICVTLVSGSPIEKPEEKSQLFGSYEFSYATPDSAKTEVRELDGSIEGAYTFADKDGLIHEVKYLAGAGKGFEVQSHKVKENGTVLELENGYTPEVQAARDTHLLYQQLLRSTLPKLEENENVEVADGAKVGLRPIPVQVKVKEHVAEVIQHKTPNLRNVPSIVTLIQKTPIHVQQKTTIMRHIPPVEMVKEQPSIHFTPASALRLDSSQDFPIEIKKSPIVVPPVKEVEIEAILPHYIRHIPSPVKKIPIVPVIDVMPPIKVMKEHDQVHHSVSPPQAHQKVIVKMIEEPIRIIHSNIRQEYNPKTIIHEEIISHPVLHQFIPKKIIVKETVIKPVEKLPLASDIMLVDGYTPEVAAARKQHLKTFEEVKASLPELKENESEEQ